MPQDYIYSVASDTASGLVDKDALHREIDIGGLPVVLSGPPVVAGDVLTITMVEALPDQAPLTAIVNAHQGVPLEPDAPQLVSIDASVEGVPLATVNSPSPQDWNAFFTGRGDVGGPGAAGQGNKFCIEFSGESGEKYVDVQFNEPVELYDGEANWDVAFNSSDELSMEAVIPANVPVVNGSNTGNCNVLDGPTYGVPPIFGNVIVPAPGNGTHDIDLASAVPFDAIDPALGWFNVDYDTGEVTARPEEGGEWALYTAELRYGFVTNVAMHHSLRTFGVDNTRVMWISPSWKIRLRVNASSNRSGFVSAWLMMFRQNALQF